MSARATLGSVELSLSELTALAPGDVVVLDRTLEAPVDLVIDALDVTCRGHLGQRDGRHALLIVAGAARSGEVAEPS